MKFSISNIAAALSFLLLIVLSDSSNNLRSKAINDEMVRDLLLQKKSTHIFPLYRTTRTYSSGNENSKDQYRHRHLHMLHLHQKEIKLQKAMLQHLIQFQSQRLSQKELLSHHTVQVKT